MKKIKTILTSLILLAAIAAVQGQTRQAFLDAAEASFETKDFYSALHYYKNVLEFRGDIGVYYKAAEAARNFNSYKMAEEYYKKVIELEQNAEFPLATYWLGEMQLYRGNYTEAKQNFELYLSENELDNPYYSETAKQQIGSIDWAMSQADSVREYVEIEHLGSNVNTPFSEYGPVMLGDTLYYASLRFPSEMDDSKQERIFSKALWSIKGGEGIQFDESFNDEKYHTGHVVFTENQDRVYYTICEYENATEIRCDIYYRDYSDDKFSEPVKLPGFINDSSYTTTQPSLGLDPVNGEQALYFASDRPGTKGKLDIWYCVIDDDDEFEEPVNLMPINTIENDLSPFYHNGTQTLYFASKGYEGFGGYDIYSVYTEDLHDPYIENLGAPVNSSYNDLYFFLADDQDTAYLASNRQGSLFLEEADEACCNDIYKAVFEDLDINLKALTFDQATQEDLLGATVTLLEASDEDKVLDSQSAENTNQFIFPLERNRSYKVIATKPGYFPDTIAFSTRGINSSQDITKRLYLQSEALDLELFVFDDETKAAIRGATVKLLDVSDPSSEIVAQINEDGNSFEFPLERDKSYQIITSKRGYKPDTLQLSTKDIPGNKISKNIYLKTGNLEDFLPLALYFDNDHPNPRTYYRTSRRTYDDTYPPYMARKEEFKQEFAEPLIDGAKAEAEDDIERFFEYQVREGRNDIVKFIEILTDEIGKGENIEIVLQGFASPRAPSAYNDLLSSRRISSVINQFRRFADGELMDAMQAGTLKIVQEPLGESKAPIYVSDEIEDDRNSIYSVPASRERRVEIIDVRRSND
ncbi:MAG: hypothetical protein HKN87_23180 [Saprospiraceae bacterium]|nr:hypothetical protein [Saprospiraceae bacterium]